MKYLFLPAFFFAMISSFVSCKKSDHDSLPAFDYEQAAGIWVPYELTIDGTVITGTLDGTAQFTGNSIFGTLAESVQLNSDKTFIPLQWINRNNFTLSTAQTGTFEYLASNKLRFNGAMVREWDIVKFENDDLWLKLYTQKLFIGQELSEHLYKFKRQH